VLKLQQIRGKIIPGQNDLRLYIQIGQLAIVVVIITSCIHPLTPLQNHHIMVTYTVTCVHLFSSIVFHFSFMRLFGIRPPICCNM